MTFDPLAIIRLLDERGIRFVLVGGLAAAAHGSPTPTLDIDICYARDEENLGKLAQVLGDLGARLRGVDDDVPFLLDAETLRAGDHFTFETRLGDLDLLGTPSGSSGYEGLAADAIDVDLGGIRVKVASLERLIEMKVAAAEILRALQDERDAARRKEN